MPIPPDCGLFSFGSASVHLAFGALQCRFPGDCFRYNGGVGIYYGAGGRVGAGAGATFRGAGVFQMEKAFAIARDHFTMSAAAVGGATPSPVAPPVVEACLT